MTVIPTLYTNYEECILDLDIYGKIVSTPQQTLEEIEEDLYEEFKRRKPAPTLEHHRYELSRLVSPDVKIKYNRDLELQDNEEVVDLSSSHEVFKPITFEDLTPLVAEVTSMFSYENAVTSSLRQSILEKFNIESGEEFERGVHQTEKLIGSVVENTETILSDEEIDNLGKDDIQDDDYDDYSVYDSDDSDAEEVTDNEEITDTEEDSYDDYDDYDVYDYSDDSSTNDDEEPEPVDDDVGDSYDDYADYDSYDDYDDLSAYDYSDEPESIESEEGDTTVTTTQDESIDTGASNNDFEFSNFNDDFYTADESDDGLFYEEPPAKPVDKPKPMESIKTVPTPAQIQHVEPKIEVDRASEPTDIRQFLRKHPNSEYTFVLQYFTKKQIEDAIKVGKIVKRGTKLKC